MIVVVPLGDFIDFVVDVFVDVDDDDDDDDTGCICGWEGVDDEVCIVDVDIAIDDVVEGDVDDDNDGAFPISTLCDLSIGGAT